MHSESAAIHDLVVEEEDIEDEETSICKVAQSPMVAKPMMGKSP